eukprot:3028838-Rhodomonas_salina.1
MGHARMLEHAANMCFHNPDCTLRPRLHGVLGTGCGANHDIAGARPHAKVLQFGHGAVKVALKFSDFDACVAQKVLECGTST